MFFVRGRHPNFQCRSIYLLMPFPAPLVLAITEACCLLTPNLFPMSAYFIPAFAISTIFGKSDSLSTVCGKRKPDAVRPFAAASLMLSSRLPANKCFGFMHFRLSHLWQMSMPFGIGPCISSYTCRWAPEAFRLTFARAYPLACTHPVYSMHPRSVMLVLPSSLSNGSLAVCFILKLPFSSSVVGW